MVGIGWYGHLTTILNIILATILTTILIQKSKTVSLRGGGRVRKIMEFSSFTNDEIYGKGGLKVKFYTVIKKI